jgi:gluconolactonase
MLSTLDNPQPEFETLADAYQGKRLNSPNDAVMDSLGNIYFTDPTYGLAEGDDDPERELEFHGIYFLMRDGELRLLDQVDRPNGIALSPDQDRLYVSSSNYLEPKWYAYNVVEPGVIEEGSLFFDTDTIPGSTNAPDGMHVSKDGLIFTSGPGGVWLVSSEGRALARINVPRLVSNCTLDAEEEYLYLTADDCLLRIKLKH